jgi:hypothetical protein
VISPPAVSLLYQNVRIVVHGEEVGPPVPRGGARLAPAVQLHGRPPDRKKTAWPRFQLIVSFKGV